MDELKIGDVVRLKSGGPTMTIEGSFGSDVSDPQITVIWFDNKEECHRDHFFVACLQKN